MPNHIFILLHNYKQNMLACEQCNNLHVNVLQIMRNMLHVYNFIYTQPTPHVKNRPPPLHCIQIPDNWARRDARNAYNPPRPLWPTRRAWQRLLYLYHCTIYTIHCTLYNVHYTLYNYTLYTVHCSLYTIQLYTIQRYTIHFTLYTALITKNNNCSPPPIPPPVGVFELRFRTIKNTWEIKT